MESTTDEITSEYPTEWHAFDALNEIEVRQLSSAVYEIRTPKRILTVRNYHFDNFRVLPVELWEDYITANAIDSVPNS